MAAWGAVGGQVEDQTKFQPSAFGWIPPGATEVYAVGVVSRFFHSPRLIAACVLALVFSPFGMAFWYLRENAQRHDAERFQVIVDEMQPVLQAELNDSGNLLLD